MDKVERNKGLAYMWYGWCAILFTIGMFVDFDSHALSASIMMGAIICYINARFAYRPCNESQ